MVLRSILVALDSTPASSTAQDLAIDLAKRLRCQITGIAVLDRAHITAPTCQGTVTNSAHTRSMEAASSKLKRRKP